MTDATPPERTERLAALLALAASKKQTGGSCPSDEELAAFVNGDLAGKKRRDMLGHLNHCPECYSHWLEIALSLNAAAFGSKPRSGVWSLSGVWQHFAALSLPWQVGVPAVTVACVLCLVVLGPTSPNLDNESGVSAGGREIGEAYVTSAVSGTRDRTYSASAIQDKANVARTLSDLVLPWEQPPLGFSDAQPSPPRQAFGAGLWAGKNAPFGENVIPLPASLSPPSGSTWSDTRWADYYQFGRWTVTLWALAKNEQREQDWDHHLRILDSLIEHFTKRDPMEREATQAVATLKRIQPLLAAVRNQADHRAYANLARELRVTIQRLGPTNL